jgi:hypothetical protein
MIFANRAEAGRSLLGGLKSMPTGMMSLCLLFPAAAYPSRSKLRGRCVLPSMSSSSGNSVYPVKKNLPSARSRRACKGPRTAFSFSAGDGNNEYDRNIQIADLNALNAALAVIKMEKAVRLLS